MKNKKAIGLMLSLALVLGTTVPGTLAASEDTETSATETTELSVASVEDTEPVTEKVTEPITEPVQEPSENNDAAPAEEETSPKEEDSQETQSDLSGSEESTNASEETNITEIVEEAQESSTVSDTEAETSAETETGTEGETNTSQEKSLFEKLMACKTLDELFAMIESTPKEQLETLTEEEITQVEEKINALAPEPEPEVVLEEYENESVISHLICPAVNFDNVAPFGDPVEG